MTSREMGTTEAVREAGNQTAAVQAVEAAAPCCGSNCCSPAAGDATARSADGAQRPDTAGRSGR